MDEPTQFQIRLKDRGPQRESASIKVNAGQEAVIFEVSDQSGIGSGSIHLRNGRWPEKVVLRVLLSGLEGFEIKVGGKTFSGAYHGEGAPRRDNCLPVRMLDKGGRPLSGRYLIESDKSGVTNRREGYYEIEVPQALLNSEARAIELSWVDFYRR